MPIKSNFPNWASSALQCPLQAGAGGGGDGGGGIHHRWPVISTIHSFQVDAAILHCTD